MLIPNHPHDERLSALASGDPEATADRTLSAHVADCTRCTDTVEELRFLRASLAELPDLRPHRPLRLLPVVTDAPSRADRIGGWARRFFAPALAAGAAVAMVGLVGTAAPAFQGAAGGGTDAGALQEADEPAGAEEAPTTLDRSVVSASPATGGAVGGEMAAPTASSETFGADAGDGATNDLRESDQPTVMSGGDDEDLAQELPIPAERSPWPMVLFTGIAVMIAAALLRWILVPRAG